MIKQIRCILTGMLLVLGSCLMMAQSGWNPDNPPEPLAKYKITVSSSPNYAYTSGTGWYSEGQQVWIYSSAYSTNYKFKYWTKNGEEYSTQNSFYYTVESENASFVAVYEYDPESPAEPEGTVSYRLYLNSDMVGGCSFSRTSGAKVKTGDYVYVNVYVNQGYKFLGWYIQDDKVGESTSYGFQMPADDVTLTAHLEYSPENPADPESAPDQPVTTKIKAKDYERLYGESNPTFEYTTNTDISGTPVLTCDADETSPVGTYSIKVDRGSVEGESLSLIDGTLIVNKAPLSVQGKEYTIKQGDDLPVFDLNYIGFKNNDTEDCLTTPPTVSCTATSDSPEGEYVVNVSGGEAANYDITCTNGKLIITKADTGDESRKLVNLSIGSSGNYVDKTRIVFNENASLSYETACDAAKMFSGADYQIYTLDASGVKYSINERPADNGSVPLGIIVNKAGSVSISATKMDCPIVLVDKVLVTEYDFSDGDYTFDSSTGTFEDRFYIHKKAADAVTITAKSYSRVYGETNPTFEYTAEGATLNGTPTITCEATATSSVGTYAITIAKGSVTNSEVKLVNGILTITKAPLTIKAGEYTKKQGEDNPTFTATYEGFKNSETADVLTTKPTISCEATKNSAVGEYTVTVSGAEAANYEISYVNGKLTISDAPVVEKKVDNPTITLSQTSYTYDGTAKEPTVTVKDGETTIPAAEYSVSYTNNTNVGTATVTITDVEGGNYAVSGSTTFTITAADGSLTAPTGNGNLVYNGTAQNLVTAGSTTTGTLEYSLDGTTYDKGIPQGTDAGSYTVYYKVTGDANHNDIAAQNFQVTIASKTVESPTISLSSTSYTYDGNAKEPTVTVKDGETTIPAAEYSVSYTNNTNVGTATVTITDKESGNYAVSGSATFAISSADGSLTPPTGKSDLVYDGTAQDLITAGTTNTGTLQYSLDGTTYTTTIPQGTDAGSYTVYYRVEGDANHNGVAAQNFQVTIAAKTVENPTITLSQTSYTYDGNAKEPTVTVKDGETTIPAAEYSVSYTNNTNVGTATVTITDKEGGNYAVSGSATFAISSADGSLTPPTGKSDLVYDGTAQDLITAGTTNTGTLQYSLDGTTYTTTIPQGTDAGSYTVYYKVTGDANHNDISAQHFDVKIAKAALTVSAGDYEIYEGDEIPSFEVKYEGFVNNETADVLTTKPTISCEATKSSSPDEYKVTVSGAEAKNYEITHVDGKLTILAKSFVSGGDDDKDEDDPATYQITRKEGEGDTPPTVAITDDKDVSGAFDIPEAVTYHNKTYTVTEIGEGAFENNTNLTNVSIPSSITNIGDKAFKGCSNLKSITVNIITPISLSVLAATRHMMTRADGSSVFDGVDKATCILYVPEGSVELYKAAPVWCEFKIILAIGSTGIKDILMTDGEAHDVYNLQGRKVKAKATSLEGLPPGVYIINGKKTILK